MKRRFALLSVLLASAAGCEQVLGLDDYQPAGEDGGSDAIQMPSPEGAPDTGAVDRATGTEAAGADVTSGLEGPEGAVELDSAAADVAPGSDSSDAANSRDGEPDGADAFAAPDSGDASTSDGMHMADGPAEAADSATEPPDSATVNTCPQRVPPGITMCCGHSACIDRQGNACNCGECNSQHCGFCCFDSNGAFSCVASPADCL
jgi:hypothetical protein